MIPLASGFSNLCTLVGCVQVSAQETEMGSPTLSGPAGGPESGPLRPCSQILPTDFQLQSHYTVLAGTDGLRRLAVSLALQGV